MNIGILEYQTYHKEYVKTLEKICEDHTVYIYHNLKMAVEESSNLDLLFVNTIKPLPWDTIKWIATKPKCKTIWTVHEANTDLKTNSLLLKKFDAISVTLQPIKDYIVKNKLCDKPIFTFPFMLHEKVYPNTNDTYVVPGKIEKFRRNYDIVFDMMNKDQKWCLLGEPMGEYGHKIMLKCIDYNDHGYNIKFFSRHVPPIEYDDMLKGSRAIVAPLRPMTLGHNKLHKEGYGQTKACGSMFEAIKYGKTFISNLDIQIDYRNYLLRDWKKYFEEEVVKKWLKRDC
jgi:hypothetical protein